MKRRSTKEKMAIPAPMKKEKSWNSSYPAVAVTTAVAAADDIQ